jgi:hypothetical protein
VQFLSRWSEGTTLVGPQTIENTTAL